jgi:hypothetical protein
MNYLNCFAPPFAFYKLFWLFYQTWKTLSYQIDNQDYFQSPPPHTNLPGHS